MKRILFTGGGGAGNEAIWRALSGRYELFFADAAPEAISPEIPAERRLKIPLANAVDFTDKLLKLARKHLIDLIVPGVDEELEILAIKKGAPHWPMILLPDHDFVALMLDKFTSANAILERGLPAPKTVVAEQAINMNFPLILKPRKGRGSRGVMKIDYASQIPAYLGLHRSDPDSVVAQQLLEGHEYTVFVCADEAGNLRAVIPVRVILKRGITIRAATEENQLIIEYAKSFQNAFRPTGIYNIQCMVTPNGKVMPFEVNPRVSTTFCLAIYNGFDPFDMMFADNTESAVFVPRENMTLSRHWTNYISQNAY